MAKKSISDKNAATFVPFMQFKPNNQKVFLNGAPKGSNLVALSTTTN